MKVILSLIIICFILASCTLTADKQRLVDGQDFLSVIGKEKTLEKMNSNDSLPKKRFKKSEIINSKFDTKLIFGIWTISNNEPACQFELDNKRFLLCDYDGNGERLYKIVNDSIFLDNPSLIFKGKIIKAQNDTLVIHWQNNDIPNTLIRWKD